MASGGSTALTLLCDVRVDDRMPKVVKLCLIVDKSLKPGGEYNDGLAKLAVLSL